MFSKILWSLLIVAAIFSCKKEKNEPQSTGFQSFTLQFGTDSTAILIDNAVYTVKNLPRSSNATQLTAHAILPTGYTISPNPATAKDYTKGVTYTITTIQGKTYTAVVTAPAYDAVANPYGIYNAKHLNAIRNGLNDSYVLINDIVLPDVTASGAASITGISDYQNYGWYSIGATYVNGGNVEFRGTLDGQSHLIKNLTMNSRPEGNPPPVNIGPGHEGKNTDGLFGSAVRATFKNIGIQLATRGINDVATNGSGYGSVGALVGKADSCTITNCFVTGNTLVSSIQYTGGLIGKISNSTVTKSYAVLTPVSGNYAISSFGDGGGLIGWASNSNISDSYATGSVISDVSAGGLIGSINTCSIKNSYASGSVSEFPLNMSGGIVAPNNLGGLIGSASSVAPSTTSIQNCYAIGSVTGANGTNASFHRNTRIGGLIGQITASSGPVSVMYSYAIGPVSRIWTRTTAPFNTGGLVGNTPNNVFINNSVCTNYWDITTTGQTYLGGSNGTLAQDNSFTANGKTTAEMKTSGTYMSWDFSTVWNVAAGTNNGYPFLRSVTK